MLGANVGVVERLRFLAREGEDLLDARRVGNAVLRLRFLARADLLLPSGDELRLLATDAASDEAAVHRLLDRGITAVVHKHGARGARYIDRTTDCFVPAFSVTEVDPTGAGDIFGATFVAGWLAGLRPEDNLRRAVAAGALAVTRQGPMEGASTAAEIDAFLQRADARRGA